MPDFEQVSPEVSALRRKALGDAALELLIAMDEGIGVIHITTPPPHNYSKVHAFDFNTMQRPANGFIIPSTLKRLASVSDALFKREFIRSQDYKTWMSNRRDSPRYKPSDEKVVSGNFWQITSQRYTVTIFTISDAGKRALAQMQDRVAAFKATPKPRYLATARMNGEERTWGVAGIYQILKETPSTFYISLENIEDARKFKHDGAVNRVVVGGRHAGDMVSRENVALVDVEVSQFNTLLDKTIDYERKMENLREQMQEKIKAMEEANKVEAARLGALLDAEVKNIEVLNKEEVTNNREIEDVVEFDLTDLEDMGESSFKP